MNDRPAVFLDRDGVLNQLVIDPTSATAESPLSVEDVHLVPGAARAAARLAQAGFVLVCVSNQPAAAKGKVTIERLLEIHQRVIGLLAREGVRLDASRLCLHHPEGVVGELSKPCSCRKPAPGMVLDAASELRVALARSWIIGDTDTDVLAGRAAGCRTALIECPASAHKRLANSLPDLLAPNLATGVELLLNV